MTSEELGQDLEHVEVLQKKFEEFQTDLAAHEERVNEVNQLAGKLAQVRNCRQSSSQVLISLAVFIRLTDRFSFINVLSAHRRNILNLK